MAAAGTRQGSVYGLLVALGARARGMRRRELAREAVEAVAAHFSAMAVTLHPNTDGWAEAQADPRGRVERLGLIDRARVAEPGNAAIIDSYGWVLYRLGRLDEARAALAGKSATHRLHEGNAGITPHLASIGG